MINWLTEVVNTLILVCCWMLCLSPNVRILARFQYFGVNRVLDMNQKVMGFFFLNLSFQSYTVGTVCS